MTECDVIVVGAGPAGSASAITCAAAGLRVAVVERELFPRSAPGETLPPGIQPLLRRLGVEEQVLAAGFLRHAGHCVRWVGPERFQSFGTDADGPWLGFQAWRPTFDAILLDRARELGVQVLQPCRIIDMRRLENGLTELVTTKGALQAPFVVDATGRRRWLSQHLGIGTHAASPRFTAWYGYVEGDCPVRRAAPSLVADADGWTWIARVRERTYAWTRLAFDGARPAGDWLPADLRGLKPMGNVCGADVTWRIAAAPAGPGYFLVGDAAAILDPASSHGVLKAVMSGMMAGHLLGQVMLKRTLAVTAARIYNDWLRTWFDADVRALRELYGALSQASAFEPGSTAG